MERDIREEMEEGSTFHFYPNLKRMSSIYILGLDWPIGVTRGVK